VIPKRFQGWQAIFHGGILATPLDEVSVHACMSECDQDVNAGIRIRYIKPVAVEPPVRVVAEGSSGRRSRLAVAAQLFCGDLLCVSSETRVMQLKGTT